MSNMNFTLSINKKNQLRDLNRYLNQKVITAINNLYGSTLVDNLITSQQAFTPAKVAENDQKSMAPRVSFSNKGSSITSLV